MSKTKSSNSNNTNKVPNPLEVIKDISKATADQMRYEANQIPRDFFDQLFGIQTPRKVSGEITPGESLEIDEIVSQKHERIDYDRKSLHLEKQLIQEEKALIEKRTNELKIQLKVLQEELLVLANKTEGLAKETQIAVMQAPVEPGEYHIVFFEKLLEYIRSFRRKIEDASVWLHFFNKRAARKNAWGATYKRFGAKYLLSGEHYLQRSAG